MVHRRISTSSFSHECILLPSHVYNMHQDTKSARLIAVCKRSLTKIGFSSLREITNYWRPRCSWLRLLSSIHELNFFSWDKDEEWFWNLKREKPQRQRRRSTHDVTENISTFSRRRNSVKMSNSVAQLGLTGNRWWSVLWILRSIFIRGFFL